MKHCGIQFPCDLCVARSPSELPPWEQTGASLVALSSLRHRGSASCAPCLTDQRTADTSSSRVKVFQLTHSLFVPSLATWSDGAAQLAKKKTFVLKAVHATMSLIKVCLSTVATDCYHVSLPEYDHIQLGEPFKALFTLSVNVIPEVPPTQRSTR